MVRPAPVTYLTPVTLINASRFSVLAGTKDLLTGTQEQEDADKDDLSLLNEILNAPSTGEDEFTQEWQAVFGAPMTLTPDTVPAEQDLSRRQAEFMPSSLLDTQLSGLSLGQGDHASIGWGGWGGMLSLGQGLDASMGVDA